MGYHDSSNLYAGFANDPVNNSDPTGEWVGFAIDAGFAIYDTWAYATGRIGGAEYAARMALTGSAVIADAATGGLGGGLAVRAATLPGRTGRIIRGGMRTAVFVNRSELAYNTVQAGISTRDAMIDGSYGRAGISTIQIGAGLLGLRSHGSRWSEINTPWGRSMQVKSFDSDLDWDVVRPPGTRLAGLSNLEAAAQGYAPIRINPQSGRVEQLILHHLNKEPGGTLATVWSATHSRRHVGDRLTARGVSKTKYDPLLNWRKENPLWDEAFDDERAVFWKWLTWAYKPPNGAVQVPPPIRPRIPE